MNERRAKKTQKIRSKQEHWKGKKQKFCPTGYIVLRTSVPSAIMWLQGTNGRRNITF